MTTEAHASWSRELENGERWTLRAADDESDAAFVERVKAFQGKLNGALAPKQATAGNGVANKQPSTAGLKSIKIESISLAAGGDHPRWVVRGGNLKKYGVTCWPETLEAAGIMGKLDPLKDNKPGGNWLAFYSQRTNDEGKLVPDKVVELQRQ